MLSAQQLTTPLTYAQIRAWAVTELQTLGLQPQNWPPGGVASSVLSVCCTILALMSGGGMLLGQSITGLAYAIAQQWNPTATGAGLQLLSQYFYGFTPPQGTFASGSLTLTNTGGGVYSYDAGQAMFGSTVANSQGVYPTYTNDAAFTINPGQTISVAVSCTFIGSGGNAAAGFVTNLVTSMLGVTCTNPFSFVGTDPLTDSALRQMNIDSLSRESPFGPRGAYRYAIETATNVVTGNPVNISKFSVSSSSHTNNVTIYVSSPTGIVDPNDLAGVAACIESGAGSTDPTFTGARPDGVTVGPGTVTLPGGQVVGAPAAAGTVTYAPSVVVYVLAPKGTASTTLQSAILASLLSWFAGPGNPIGGITAADDANTAFTGIFESGVAGVISQAVSSVTGCTMLATRFSGQSDLPLLANQVATCGMTSSNLVVNVQYMGS